MRGMSDDLPVPVPGPSLREKRLQVGISQADLAKRVGVHRVSLNDWENRASLDPIRAAKYERALRELIAEAIPESVA